MTLAFEGFKLPRVEALGLQLRFLPHRSRRPSPPTTVAASTTATTFTTMFFPSTVSDPASPRFASIAAVFLRRSIVAFLFLAALVSLYRSTLLPFSSSPSSAVSSSLPDLVLPYDSVTAENEEYSLERVLKAAATDDKTVIITALNEAWAAPNSVFDLFLESFRIGKNTRKFLDHLVVVALDAKAFRRCLLLHNHCFALVTEGTDFSQEAYFMTPDYLKMMWRRIDFLRSILEMGYNFVFTDTDIMWFRNPFPRFYPDADFQIACDIFSGNSSDLQNRPNGGFTYVRSSNRSIAFYRFWHSSQHNFTGYHDQDVLNFIKHDSFISEIGLRIRFLDTAYFGGLCEPSKDFNLVCTMHANCCVGMDTKLNDLRIMLQDWRDYMSLPPTLKKLSAHSWRVPKHCSLDFLVQSNPSGQPNVDNEQEYPS